MPQWHMVGPHAIGATTVSGLLLDFSYWQSKYPCCVYNSFFQVQTYVKTAYRICAANLMIFKNGIFSHRCVV